MTFIIDLQEIALLAALVEATLMFFGAWVGVTGGYRETH